MTGETAREAVRAMLAAEGQFPAGYLRTAGVRLVELPPATAPEPPMRRFDHRELFAVVTMGDGIMVSATPAWYPWVRELYRDVGTVEGAAAPMLMGAVAAHVGPEGYVLHGPNLHFVTSARNLKMSELPDGYDLKVGGGDLEATLNALDWPNAVYTEPNRVRPTVIVGIARRRGRVVGVAGASADSDAVWQIGIDVAETDRGVGIGRALTSIVASEVLAQGRVPYYSIVAGNVRSMRTALSTGFFPAWVDIYTSLGAAVPPD